MRKPLIAIATAAVALAALPTSGSAAVEQFAAPQPHPLERSVVEAEGGPVPEAPGIPEAEPAPSVEAPATPDGFAGQAPHATEDADQGEAGQPQDVEASQRSLPGLILSGLFDLVVPSDGPASGEAVAAKRYEGGATGDGPATEEECERTAEVASEAQEIADQDYESWQNGGGSGAMWGYLHMQMSVNTLLDGGLERGCFFLDHGDSKSSQ